jgi:hypothetical protein
MGQISTPGSGSAVVMALLEREWKQLFESSGCDELG